MFAPCGAAGGIDACTVPSLVDDPEKPTARSNFPAGSCLKNAPQAESTRMVASQCARESVPVVRSIPHSWKKDYLYLPEPHDPPLWAGQMFRLSNVYVDAWGHVFNATHFFDMGRCTDVAPKVRQGCPLVETERGVPVAQHIGVCLWV